jgi:hypothetical protein
MQSELERQDRLSYDSWVAQQIVLYESTGCTAWFDSSKALRLKNKNRHSQPPRDAFTGAYWAAKPWLTQEAIDWFEVQCMPRYTFSEWRGLEAVQRAQELEEETHGPLDQLAYIRQLEQSKGEVICEARVAGASWDEITRATGLSRMTCNTLAKTYRDALTPARETIITDQGEEELI